MYNEKENWVKETKAQNKEHPDILIHVVCAAVGSAGYTVWTEF